jgi:hypothetical protein
MGSRRQSSQIVVLSPPHYRVEDSCTRDLAGLRGLVVGVGVSTDLFMSGHVSNVLPSLDHVEMLLPAAVIAVVLTGPRATLSLNVVRSIRLLGRRCVLEEADLRSSVIRDQLTRPQNLAKSLARWFGRHTALHLNGSIELDLLQQGLEASPQDRIRLPPSGRQLPGTHTTHRDWFDLGRALRTALHLHREPNATLFDAADTLGFHDAASLSRSVSRILGHRPTFIQPRVGWEWLVRDWARSKVPSSLRPSPALVSEAQLRSVARLGTDERWRHAER